MARAARLLFALGVMACTKKADDLVPPADDTDLSDDLPTLTGSCPVGAPIAGAAGQSHRDAFTVTWRWSEARQMSVADPIFVDMPADVAAFAATVDAGTAKSAFARLWLDDRVIVDIDEVGTWPERARARHKPRGAATTDTWDTWWDSSWTDSGGTGWDSAWDSAWDTGADPVPGWGVWPLFAWPEVAATVALPMAPDLRGGGPGCLAIVPAAMDDLTGQTGTVHLVTRRVEPATPHLAMNLIVVEGSGITQQEIDQSIASMQALYIDSGGPIVDVAVFDLPWPGPAVFNFNTDLFALRAAEVTGGDDDAINMFLIQDFVGSSGTIGMSAGIPGPVGVPGTAGSGVVTAIDGHRKINGELNIEALAGTMAHESGHQLGLFHTSESSGQSFDVLDDTVECTTDYDFDSDGTVWAGECRNRDGHNFMFWAAGGQRFAQREVSPAQAYVLSHGAAIHEGGQ